MPALFDCAATAEAAWLPSLGVPDAFPVATPPDCSCTRMDCSSAESCWIEAPEPESAVAAADPLPVVVAAVVAEALAWVAALAAAAEHEAAQGQLEETELIDMQRLSQLCFVRDRRSLGPPPPATWTVPEAQSDDAGPAVPTISL
ncbi:MAG TPA: hypothetical protein VME92_10865 [Acetobacteraceae bacterium]|nr:hypothetical protein [Acetobacteraceae bacterium]